MDAKFPFFFFSIVSLVCFDRFRSRIFLTLRGNIFLLDRAENGRRISIVVTFLFFLLLVFCGGFDRFRSRIFKNSQRILEYYLMILVGFDLKML